METVPRLVGINHVAVAVRDIDEELGFLENVFDDVRLRGRSGSMAFVDMGDQFIALATGTPRANGHEHIGLVVDDREETLRRARAAGARIVGRNDVLDPSGNRWQVVDYRDVQFTKAPRILEGMGLREIEKSPRAVEELRAKGLAD
ncbi:MAG: VOC family protein [Actinobacteria bacterium]|nr:MAG: VOC family protein [Actinomycetota bacterium]